MRSDLDILGRICPRCGSPITPSGTCSKEGCWYVRTDENSIDISFKCQGIAKALSNLCNYKFTFDNVECASMESFIQSLRISDVNLQEEVCSLSGPFCYSIRTTLPDWRKTQKVYWRGRVIDRHSDEYTSLLANAYYSLYTQSAVFKHALDQSKGYKLLHTIGYADKSETLLSPEEYISQLNRLRGE